eukprot:jgi/Psemu1/60053/gm1.60053_g
MVVKYRPADRGTTLNTVYSANPQHRTTKRISSGFQVSHQDTVYSSNPQHRRVYSANPQHRTSKRPRIASQIVASRFPPSNVSLTGDSNVSAPPSVRESRYRRLQRLSYRRLQRLSAPPSVHESRYRRLQPSANLPSIPKRKHNMLTYTDGTCPGPGLPNHL